MSTETATTERPRAFAIGDQVVTPGGFCPGCMCHVWDRVGPVVGFEPAGDVHWQLAEENPGEQHYYKVTETHVHGAGQNLVYAERELRPATTPGGTPPSAA